MRAAYDLGLWISVISKTQQKTAIIIIIIIVIVILTKFIWILPDFKQLCVRARVRMHHHPSRVHPTTLKPQPELGAWGSPWHPGG
jgi:hypothetical protein